MVVTRGGDIALAKEKVYSEIEKIRCGNLFFRRDIAHWAFEYETH